MTQQAQIAVEQLVDIGGSRWARSEHDRVYFNDLATWYGLECSYYGTGNISSATVDGERVSNSSARRIGGMLGLGKLWFDVRAGQFRHQGLSDNAFAKLVERITEKASAMAATDTADEHDGRRCAVCGQAADMAASRGYACADHYDQLSD